MILFFLTSVCAFLIGVNKGFACLFPIPIGLQNPSGRVFFLRFLRSRLLPGSVEKRPTVPVVKESISDWYSLESAISCLAFEGEVRSTLEEAACRAGFEAHSSSFDLPVDPVLLVLPWEFFRTSVSPDWLILTLDLLFVSLRLVVVFAALFGWLRGAVAQLVDLAAATCWLGAALAEDPAATDLGAVFVEIVDVVPCVAVTLIPVVLLIVEVVDAGPLLATRTEAKWPLSTAFAVCPLDTMLALPAGL